TCDCGYSYTKKIDKIKHNFIDGVCDCGLVISDGPVEIWDMSYNSRELVTAFLYHDPEAEGLFRLVIRGNGRGRWYNTPWKIYKDEISEVVFENGVKYDVPGRGFENFTELRRVILGDGIEMIGNGAFRGCQNLQYVEVTEALLRIEPTAFADCKSLEIVEGISKLERLGGNAFINCISLYRFDAEYVREIQPRAFANCQGLKEVSIIGGIEILGDGAFERCVCLTDVGNLDNLQRMGRYVFRDCLEIRTLILNDNCELTMDAAFANMRNLETVIITGKVTEIPRYTFQGCKNLKTVYISTYDPVIVKRAAFADCNNLKNLVIKGGILDMEEEAFRVCRALEGVYIETESPISIKMRAFEQCVSLKSVIVTGGIMSIGDSAFGGCIALEEITLSEHTEAIGANAFSQCRALKQIFIPNSVQSISRYAFNGCNRLTIYTEDGVDLGAFDNCNPSNRPVVSGAIRDEFFIDRHCPHYEYEEWVEKEPTHHSIGLLLRKCLICGNCDGEILEPHIDHEFSEWKSDGSATHTRYCACGYTETNNHIFQSGECVECGLKKTVLVRDDIECVEMTNGGIDFEILFDGAKNTTGLYENSNIEYYPSSKHDYIIITLTQEVDLGGIIFWICGDKSSARVTVYDSNNRKTGEGVVRFNGGDYYDG
ncbi:MAG: leucine-rich repeat domain-containing protein, partial [Clostridia bacterium]|nr:leucine-rich repeat domain-containing protein [Clostridia bacterium]